jgi:2-haloacid dehalogenase
MKSRRTFLKKSIPLSLLAVSPFTGISQVLNTNNKIEEKTTIKPKVLFFDINETLLDLQPLKESVVAKLNGNKELGTLWFTTMLQYSLVATVGNQYFDFGKIGAATLMMVAKNNNFEISEDEAKVAIKPILSLKPHPEVKEALSKLKKAGYQLVSFTNSSNNAVKQQLDFAEITSFFDEIISIEDHGKYKPHIDVYYWAARKMKVDNSDCMLIAAHGWDVAGAKWAGWQTAFIARPGQQLFPLGLLPDINEKDLLKVVEKL